MAVKRTIYVIYQLVIGVNQLLDRGHSENQEVIMDKMINGEFINYLTTKYKKENINEFNFSPQSEGSFPEVIKLLEDYGSVLPLKSFDYYGIKNNGLILASSVLSDILLKEAQSN